MSDHETYARTMAELLQKEHGNSHRAVKLLMQQTHASERAAKHWLSGQHGPDTVFFLRLMVSSPVIRAFVLGLIERPAASGLGSSVDRYSLAAARAAYIAGENAADFPPPPRVPNDPGSDPKRDPMNDPDPADLNERQHWFLDRVGQGYRCAASEIETVWSVSPKTARRDIAGLKAAGLVSYVGSRRKGRYSCLS
uniref:hypothetical protein n=1 Tax=Sphingomonas bacterium TaxID=1895847 RepID=UPI002618318E|nr:hypothetical protein [Sphingomonas bacterium]